MKQTPEITDEELAHLRCCLPCCSDIIKSLLARFDRVEREKEDMRQHCIHCIDEPDGALFSAVTMLEKAEADRNKLCEALDILMEHVDKYGNSAFQTQWNMARQVASILAETTIYAERPMKWGHLQDIRRTCGNSD